MGNKFGRITAIFYYIIKISYLSSIFQQKSYQYFKKIEFLFVDDNTQIYAEQMII